MSSQTEPSQTRPPSHEASGSTPGSAAPAPALARLQRLVRLSLGLNGLLLLGQGVLFYVLFAIVLAEPAQIAGVTDTTGSEGAAEEGDYREEMRTFFERTADLLDREARKQGVNPSDVLPSDAEINDAVETRTMHSDESQRVLQKLREGFEYFDLTWPLVIPER